jgi:protein-disulfide isomerase
MAFAKGNKHGEKSRVIEQALRRAVAQDDGVRLRRMVEAVLDKAAEGELAHIAWLADRLDGKPKQQIEQTIDANIAFDETIGTAAGLLGKLRKPNP